MIATTLSFENMHSHGELFVNLLRARRETFIVRKQWDLPENCGMEYDQYDNPASRWVAVHEGGKVLAGVRLTPSTARVGIYSYMIRDAQKGMLDSIPSNILYDMAPVDPLVWEASRIFVSPEVRSTQRLEVHRDLMGGMMRAARGYGVATLLGLVPAVWPRWISRMHIEAEEAGPPLEIDGVWNQVARMDLSGTLH